MPRFPEEIYLAIAQRIRERRKTLRITQIEMARLLKLDRTAITRIENGSRHLEDAVDLFLIAEKLQVPLVSFFPNEVKFLIEKAPKSPNTFNLLPNIIRQRISLSEEAVGSISSSQLYALLEIFKKNPWGKLRRMVASIFTLLRDTWASDLLINEMENILIPSSNQETLRFHTRLLAAEVLSAFVLSPENLILPRGKEIQKKLEQCIESLEDPTNFEFLFCLRALSNMGVYNVSASKMEELYPIVREQVNDAIKVCHLIFAHQWGEFLRKDGSSNRLAFENYLNLIISQTRNSAFAFCLKIWAQSIKSKYYYYRSDWLNDMRDNYVYQGFNSDEKALILIIAICASLHEFNYLEQQEQSDSEQCNLRKKDQIKILYNDLLTIYQEIQSTIIKVWLLQTLFFLREDLIFKMLTKSKQL